MKKKVAIIGGGIAGLTAAYFLNKKYDITLFEKDDRLGGNSYTLTTNEGLIFDIAVAVFGKISYPNFCTLLKRLNVETMRFSGPGAGMRNIDTKEDFTVSWGYKGLKAQNFSILKPKHVASMVYEFVNLYRGKKLYEQGKLNGLTMREAMEILAHESDARLMTMFGLCIVSSMYYEEIMKAPADFFFGKMAKHKDFFTLRSVYAMCQAKNNTKSYVDALAANFKDKVVLNSSISSIERKKNESILKIKDGSKMHFDKVVFACNADQALSLLEKPTEEEKNLLGVWKYKDGPIVVHKDKSSFPEKELYNMYTFLYTNKNNKVHTSVTGHIRCLKSVPDDCQYVSSQHPNFPIAKNLIEFQKVFRTPIFDTDSVQVIKDLPTLNGKMNTYYCGSHFGYGLHEDAVTSAIDVGKMLGVGWD